MNQLLFESTMPLSTTQTGELKTSKIIRDPVHGYIGLTELEHQLLQLPALNRLHHIRQLALAHQVYPGALTTRFVHSVGVLHVASKMIRTLRQNTPSEVFDELFPDFREKEFARLEQTVRLAGLLHDVGHGPFSHVSESVMNLCLEDTDKKEGAKIFQTDSFPVHEFFSIQIIRHGSIASVLDRQDKRYVRNVCALICKDTFGSEFAHAPDGLEICRRLISGQLDADRMDYLLRDAYSTGVIYGSIDADRIVLNLSVRKDRIGKYHIAVHERALSAIEDMLDARFKMYKWVYGHHLVVSAAELLRKCLEDMVSNKLLTRELFGWRNFETGESDDHSLWNFIRTAVSKNAAFAKYKGITDRRFLPISLFKRPAHVSRLVEKVIERTGRQESDENVRRRIERLILEQGLQEQLRKNIEKEKMPVSDATLFGVNLPPSPYRPVRPDDMIWVCGEDDLITELTEESTYSSAISREWGEFPSPVFCYVIPNMPRKEAKAFADQIERVLVDTLASVS